MDQTRIMPTPEPPGPLPLTNAQRGVVAACLVAPDETDFIVGDVLRLSDLRPEADIEGMLRRSVERVVAETPWLGWRLTDADPGSPLVPGEQPRIHSHDLRGSEQAWEQTKHRARADVTTPLSLTAPCLTRLRVWALSDTEAAVSIAVHHVLLDGYGVHLMLRRILATYAHLTGDAPAPRAWTDPGIFVAEESAYAGSDAARADREFWAAAAPLEDAVHSYRLPRTPSPDGTLVTTAVSLGAAVDDRARALGVTFVELVAAAHATVLARWAHSRDVIIGIPLMNRMGSSAAYAPTCTVNVLPLAVHIDPHESARTLLERISRDLRSLRRHGRFRAEDLLTLHGHHAHGTAATGTELNVKLFGALPAPARVHAEIVNLAEGPIDDVSISVLLEEGDTVLHLSAPAGTSGATLDALARTLAQAMTDIESAPDAPLGDAAARASAPDAALAVAAAPHTARPSLLHERLAVAARTHPARAALVHRGQTWNHTRLFTEVTLRTAALAQRCEAGQPVVLDLPRDADALAWYLAATAAGFAGVPIDTRWPAARKEQILAHLAVAAARARSAGPIVLSSAESQAWRAEVDVADPAAVLASAHRVWAQLSGSSLAYVIHTSGSTGTPKPVVVSQAALARHLQTFGGHSWGHPDAGHHIAALTLPLVFDGSWDMLSALVWGHTVVLVDHETAQDPRACACELRARGVSAIDSTPTIVEALLDEGLLTAGHTLTQINVGGEACPPHVWERLVSAHTATGASLRAHNYYGPTESTVDATRLGSLESADARAVGENPGASLIGSAVEGTAAYVLDAWLRPVPHGVRGELYLAGEQLAHGYFGMSARTAERFVADPFAAAGDRMYRTGDIVRMLPTGHLIYESRSDHQLKVRGYRIEPREVESALERLPGVRRALVRSDGTRLLAWVSVEHTEIGRDATAEELLDAARAILPDHLLPAAIMTVEAFPRTATGKIDDAALPRPDTGDTGRLPVGPAETALARSFADVLEVTRPGADADFFRLGGDSIRAIRLVARVREEGFVTSVSQVFAHRTLARIAAACTARDTPHSAASPTPSVATLVTDPSAFAAVSALLQARSTRTERASRR